MQTSTSNRPSAVVIYPPLPASSVFLKVAMIFLLLACLLKMPYGYYQFVRFAAFVSFGILAVQYFNNTRFTLSIFFGTLSVLFQPFLKIALGRTIWNVVDVIVAVILLVTLISETKRQRN